MRWRSSLILLLVPLGAFTARAGDEAASADVTVAGSDQPHEWSFRNHVQSVLSKLGCNSGACHGAAAGKNGFRLSLRGYDPEFDFFSITRQSRGRRVVPDDPGRSLLLTKPSGAIPHKGGLRFQIDSVEYRVLAEWIAAGHPGPSADDPRLERLEILPEHAMLSPQATQQLIVRGHFSDGRVEDVTRWAKFTSNNQTVANVDQDGKVTVMGRGEGAVVAWYLSQNVVASITVPHEQSVAAEFFASAGRGNFLDDLVLAKLRELNLPPSPPASDAEFLRRAFLDTIGILPTVEETRLFLADNSPEKRERLADTLLERPEFVDYWTYKWSDLLLLSGERLRPQALDTFYYWIRQQVEKNTPWDEFARQIVTAKGSTFENGAANFYSLHQDPLDMAETVSMAFLGTSIQCAHCHDHPLEKWTNDQYYGMANLFARVRGKGWGGDFRSGDGNRMIFTVESGELIQPRTGRPQPPRPLDAEPLPLDDPRDRREYLAEWLTSPENAYFSRAIANRVWANFFGVGIVEAVDDMRLTNPPSNETLLAALAGHLVEQDYDLKQLMRLILTSKTYQRSSLPAAGNESDARFYSRYYPKRLPAEVLLDALSQATGAATVFAGYDPGTRALQLRDASIDSYFLETFGRPERLITCECERSNDPSMKQILHITNGDTLNEKLSRKADPEKKLDDNRIGQLLARGASNAEIIEEAYLASLSRYPTEDERAAVLQVLDAAPAEERRLVVEDLFWSLLSGKEFLFNH
ncbi:MAG TPA: DUF1553 domain-containing protein [Planctomycetaceae bacterium]|nr:DUF1553 domain-containing protein [Planctomycetaceae bacterium]